jgi:hypothetical protein
VFSGSALGVFATNVESYEKGTLDSSFDSYTTPSSALGAPAPVVGVGVFPNVLSAFSPAYLPPEIVVVGDGGHLTLKLAAPVVPQAGPEIGVISNVGLSDGGGFATPNVIFGGGWAEVLVSENGSAFVSLGTIVFENPASYFTNAGPYDSSAPSSPGYSDLGKPFTGTLSSFAGQTYAQVLSTLDGSIGGTWIDISPANLASVQYVKFVVADDGDPFTKFAVDSVTTVPEPAAVGMLLCAMPLLGRRRRV